MEDRTKPASLSQIRHPNHQHGLEPTAAHGALGGSSQVASLGQPVRKSWVLKEGQEWSRLCVWEREEGAEKNIWSRGKLWEAVSAVAYKMVESIRDPI